MMYRSLRRDIYPLNDLKSIANFGFISNNVNLILYLGIPKLVCEVKCLHLHLSFNHLCVPSLLLEFIYIFKYWLIIYFSVFC